MSSGFSKPSTLDGIKRLAKNIKRERNVPHHLALDIAAGEAGYQNIRHAQEQLQARIKHGFKVFLTAYWAAGRAEAGRETLSIELPKPLGDIIPRHQITAARNLGWFHLESADHLERRIDLNSQATARDVLLTAARTLHFMAATGLRPATTQKQERPMRVFDSLPGRDHQSYWFDGDTGAWVFLDEPYPHIDVEQRRAWAQQRDIRIVGAKWDGLHNPGSAVPYVFCVDETLADRLPGQLERLQASGERGWDGESASYFSQFVGPARQASGAPRRPRPMPAPRGVARNGALPYGGRGAGQSSLWRPAIRMSLDTHLTIGPLLYALDHELFPGPQRRTIGRVRSTLDDWLQLEYPGDEMSSEQFNEAYYGKYREPIVARAAQLDAIRSIATKLRDGYPSCVPRDKLISLLANVETRLGKSASGKSL
jgi:hypothetical protein